MCQRRRDDKPEKYFLYTINTSDPRSFIKGSENSATSQTGLRHFEEHPYFNCLCLDRNGSQLMRSTTHRESLTPTLGSSPSIHTPKPEIWWLLSEDRRPPNALQLSENKFFPPPGCVFLSFVLPLERLIPHQAVSES